MSHSRKRGAHAAEDPVSIESKAPSRVELSEDAFDIDPDELEAHLLAMDQQMGDTGPLRPLGLGGSLPLAPLPPSPTNTTNTLSASRGAGPSSSGSSAPALYASDDRDFLADPDLAREFDEPFEPRTTAQSAHTANTHVCQDCGSISYNVVFQKVFGLLVCNACRRAGSGRDEAGQQTGKYALCTKGVAKDHYLLSDGELADLPFISKPNPRKQSWGDMKLFLRSQVEAKSFEKYGDAAGLTAAKHKREVTRIERRLAANKRQRRKEAPPRPYVPPPEHVHTFERVSAPSDSTEVTERCTGCRLERTFEEF